MNSRGFKFEDRRAAIDAAIEAYIIVGDSITNDGETEVAQMAELEALSADARSLELQIAEIDYLCGGEDVSSALTKARERSQVAFFDEHASEILAILAAADEIE